MTADLAGALRALAEALPPGTAVPVPRDTLLALLGPKPADQCPTDQLLTAEQVAARLGASEAWVYRQARRWPFARKLGRRCLRFSETGLDRWLANRKAS